MLLAGLLACQESREAVSAGNATAPAAAPDGWQPGAEDLDPPSARLDLLGHLREEQQLVRHDSDGGGRAWVESVDGAPPRAVAGRSGRWVIVYEAGPLGIQVGGSIGFVVPPYWQWSPPWSDDAVRPEELPAARDRERGYTQVSTLAQGVGLQTRTFFDYRMQILVTGRALREGDQVRIDYGAGRLGARADDFAEQGSAFVMEVDGDGDGVSGHIRDLPRVDVAPGVPAGLVAHVTSCVPPGEPAHLTLAVLDPRANAGAPFEGDVLVLNAPEGWGLPERLPLAAADRGRARVTFTPTEEGVFRLELEAPDGWKTTTNPLVVQAQVEPILWGDLHGHSNLSDGTGTAEQYFDYARNVAALDAVALTDHDHWGTPFLDGRPDLWDGIREQVRAFHEPHRFVALLGYEWTNWVHGHRHVVSFEVGEDLEILSSMDAATETPRQLWSALRGRDVLTFAHHSAGGPVATNWTFAPDPVLEPVTEIVSVHGSSEARDSPRLIYDPRPGNFVRDVLDAGYRLGFVGSGDSHDGHPGLPHLVGPSGGLAAFLTDDLTRAGLLTALRARRVYATSGPRIIVRCSLDGERMGALVPARDAENTLVLVVHGTAPLKRLDVVRSGQVVLSQALEGLDFVGSVTLPGLQASEYVYVRVVQSDGHAAWTSPFFVE